MAGWIDIPGAVAGTTVYCDGALCARNAAGTLPEVTFTTVELPAGGTVEMPVPGMVDAMEATVTVGNPDASFAALCAPGSHEVEFRWAQQSVDSEGNSKMSGYKAFLRANGKTLPGISLELGSAPENEVTLGVTRYRLVKDGVEVLLIDQLNGIFKFNGVDYSGGVEALL